MAPVVDEDPGGVRTFFDSVASGWSARYRDDPAMAARLVRFATALEGRVRPGAKVLDFGCGAGVLARWLALRGYEVRGCDVSSEMIGAARREAEGAAIQWDACEEGRAPYPDGAFGAVVCSSVLEYVADLSGTLGELRRVLVPGGWLIATVPDTRDPYRWWEAVLQRFLRFAFLSSRFQRSRWAEGVSYLRLSRNRLSPREWERCLRARGFRTDPVGPCEDPLLMLCARRERGGE